MPEESMQSVPQQVSRSPIQSCGLLLAVCFLFVLPFALWLGWLLNHASQAAKRASGGNDLHAPLTACFNFSKDHGGALPPLDSEPGRLMFDRKVMHEKYAVTGMSVTMEYDRSAPHRWPDYAVNPELNEDINLIDDHSWWYLGYAIRNESEARDFLRAYLVQCLQGKDLFSELAVPGTNRALTRLRVPDKPIADSLDNEENAGIPVFVERPGHYRGYTGGHVAYLDGHVEYHDYPGPFPMSQDVISILQAVDQVGQALGDSGEKLH